MLFLLSVVVFGDEKLHGEMRVTFLHRATRVPTAVFFDTPYQNSKISEIQKAITPGKKG